MTTSDEALVQDQEASVLSKQLQAARVEQTTKLDLSGSCLAELPEAVFGLSSLRDLNLANNHLTELPNAIGQLTQLRFLNAMNNRLQQLPDELCQLSQLYRLGLKGNELRTLPEAFGELTSLVELFLTKNELRSLPASTGSCASLVKLQASRNKLESLPATIGALPQLELLRVAVNKLQRLPEELFAAPRLAWVSIAGNPLCPPASPPTHAIVDIASADIQAGAKLGDGASGEVFEAVWRGKQYAVKQFKFDCDSPDGQASDEIAVQLMLDHPALTRVVAHVEDKDPAALVMELVQGAPMAQKPNFEYLLRCRWPEGATYSVRWICNAAADVASALAYMHQHHVAHGDVYAHNMLARADGHTVLCDYGAAFFYPPDEGAHWQALEVRAFGLFLRDVLDRVAPEDLHTHKAARDRLQQLCEQTLAAVPGQRPTFDKIASAVQGMLAQC